MPSELARYMRGNIGGPVAGGPVAKTLCSQCREPWSRN